MTTLIEQAISAHMWIGLEAQRIGNTSAIERKWVTGAPVTFENFDSSLNRPIERGGAAVGESATAGLWNLRHASERCEASPSYPTVPITIQVQYKYTMLNQRVYCTRTTMRCNE